MDDIKGNGRGGSKGGSIVHEVYRYFPIFLSRSRDRKANRRLDSSPRYRI